MFIQDRRSGRPDKLDDPLPCPGCGSALKEVSAEANYGRHLLLDQCPDCGGIWFDHWELYFLKPGEVNRIDPVDREKLLALACFKSRPGQCPRCRVDLEPLQDPALPKDARIERCAKCNGLWLNRGELRRYAGHKAGVLGKQEGRSAQQPGIPLNPALLDDPKRLETLKSLGRALSTRVSPGIGQSLNFDDAELDRSELAKDLVFVILQVLLRLVLKI
jgi:Zn-finger nucleic acid-binding protein